MVIILPVNTWKYDVFECKSVDYVLMGVRKHMHQRIIDTKHTEKVI